MKPYTIITIRNYPENGKHQECLIDMPFQIRKGEDGYQYRDKSGNQKEYNLYKNEDKIDERWICHLTEDANDFLHNIFEVKCNKDLDIIIKYCLEMYEKSLELEINRLKEMKKELD